MLFLGYSLLGTLRKGGGGGGFENVKTRSPFNFGPWRIDAVGHPMYNIYYYMWAVSELYIVDCR